MEGVLWGLNVDHARLLEAHVGEALQLQAGEGDIQQEGGHVIQLSQGEILVEVHQEDVGQVLGILGKIQADQGPLEEIVV